jgi:hypothetical protein
MGMEIGNKTSFITKAKKAVGDSFSYSFLTLKTYVIFGNCYFRL